MDDRCKWCKRRSERVGLGLTCFHCGHHPGELSPRQVALAIIVVVLLTTLVVFSPFCEAQERGTPEEFVGEFGGVGTKYECFDRDNIVYDLWINPDEITWVDEDGNAMILAIKLSKEDGSMFRVITYITSADSRFIHYDSAGDHEMVYYPKTGSAIAFVCK